MYYLFLLLYLSFLCCCFLLCFYSPFIMFLQPIPVVKYKRKGTSLYFYKNYKKKKNWIETFENTLDQQILTPKCLYLKVLYLTWRSSKDEFLNERGQFLMGFYTKKMKLFFFFLIFISGNSRPSFLYKTYDLVKKHDFYSFLGLTIGLLQPRKPP